MEGNGLSINEINLTNQDVIITYTPDLSVNHYSYSIIKNNKKSNEILIDSNESTDILLNDTGSYKIEITTYNIYNKKELIKSGYYNIDKDKPVIEVKNKKIVLKEGENLSIDKNVSVSDNNKDVTISNNFSDINIKTPGVKKVTYLATDKAGNTASETITITVNENHDSYIHIVQLSICFSVLIFLLLLIKFIKSLRKEYRLKKYSIKPIKDNTTPYFENIFKKYNEIIDSLTNVFVKSSFISNISKRYKKYMDVFYELDKTPVTFFSRKVICGFIFVGAAIITKALRFDVLMISQIIIPFIVGFYALDLIFWYRYRLYRNNIENDLLQAIIIMNNAFKSGRSISQAIDLVSNELKGPISLEFKKISLELSFGLDIEVAFKRFSERINIEEATYLTSSLSILNKTGGNIIKVFDSIEKTLFNRKKLRLELKSLTGSSKLIMYVLILVPITFVLLVNIISPSYFEPLFKSVIGYIIIIIILILYIAYIFIVKKVMKIRM